ncbi:MAG TPA: ribosome recycling factor [Candidatus Saccharimonadales bacterium]|jgi:ribosome recycling factor|nr:ribosome recycling factor [Candidatus Saccharimonadales bacterium]
MFDTKPYQARLQAAFTHLQDELKKVRTGRAHPSMLDSVQVEAYGSKMPLNQVANVTVPESQSLQITPFDPANLQNIVTAIRNDQSLGMNPSDDGRLVRVPIPPLTEDRRRDIVKQLGEKVEECRIALRNIRQDGIKDAKRKKDAKELSEDDVKHVEKEFDKLMGEFQLQIEAAFKAKEQEIMTI